MLFVGTGMQSVLPVGLRILTVLAIWLAVSMAELGRIDLPAPQARRQIPRRVFLNGPYRASLQFGAELGSGVRTFISSYLPYAAVAALVLLGDSYLEALLLGAGFGIGRAVPLFVRQGATDGQAWDRQLVLVLKRGGLLAAAVPAAALLTAL